MKILITGETGLVGSNLLPRLQADGHDVYGASRSKGFDLTDDKFTNACINLLKPDVVYHLAANAAEARGQISPIDMTQRNIGIFTNVLRASINAGVKRFIYTSSVAVYGSAPTPYMEDGPTIPKDVYGVNKLACEQILKIMAKVYGFEYVIFRPHNIYGPGQNMNDPTRNVVALFMRRLLEKQPYKLYGQGLMRRAFSYVDDVVNVLAESLEDKYTGKTINVGSVKDITIKELSDTLQFISGRKVKIEHEAARHQEIMNFIADHTTQREITSYKETSLIEGMLKTWEWARKQELKPLLFPQNEICLPQK